MSYKFYCDGCGKELPNPEGQDRMEFFQITLSVNGGRGTIFSIPDIRVDACTMRCAAFVIRDKLEEYEKEKAEKGGGE